MLIDTHCHLDKMKDLKKIITLAEDNKVEKFIIPGVVDNYDNISQICELNDNIFFTVGTHPSYSSKHNMKELKKYISHEKCIGVGETGLDYHWGKTEEDRKLQEKVFIEQIELSIAHNLPLVIHSRDSKKDKGDADVRTFEILSKYPNTFGVIHSFMGNKILLGLREKFYYSINGKITYEKMINKTLDSIPLNRLLIETDSPWLSPIPYKGKPNQPAYLKIIFDDIKEKLKLSEIELETIIEDNTSNLFKI